MGVYGVLKRLFAEFVSASMISLAVSHRGCGVGVGCKVVELSDSIVWALWHLVLSASVDAVMYAFFSSCATWSSEKPPPGLDTHDAKMDSPRPTESVRRATAMKSCGESHY